MLLLSLAAKAGPIPRASPTVPHVSKLLADGRPHIAESSSGLLSCVTQRFMCLLVAGSKQNSSLYTITTHKPCIVPLSP